MRRDHYSPLLGFSSRFELELLDVGPLLPIPRVCNASLDKFAETYERTNAEHVTEPTTISYCKKIIRAGKVSNCSSENTEDELKLSLSSPTTLMARANSSKT